MIKRLIWTIWTPMSSVLKKADKLNLSLSLSLPPESSSHMIFSIYCTASDSLLNCPKHTLAAPALIAPHNITPMTDILWHPPRAISYNSALSWKSLCLTSVILLHSLCKVCRFWHVRRLSVWRMRRMRVGLIVTANQANRAVARQCGHDLTVGHIQLRGSPQHVLGAWSPPGCDPSTTGLAVRTSWECLMMWVVAPMWSEYNVSRWL